jgi:HEAT repeat protein
VRRHRHGPRADLIPSCGALALRPLLLGGDRRSLAGSKRALELVLTQPERVKELANLAGDEDWLVALRALDLLEKLAHQHPTWIAPHRRLFVGSLADSDKWEVRLQIVRALPLFHWSPSDRERAVQILLRDTTHPRTFVRAWATDSLARFAEEDATLRPLLERHLREMETSGQPALVTRARHIRARPSRP